MDVFMVYALIDGNSRGPLIPGSARVPGILAFVVNRNVNYAAPAICLSAMCTASYFYVVGFYRLQTGTLTSMKK